MRAGGGSSARPDAPAEVSVRARFSEVRLCRPRIQHEAIVRNFGDHPAPPVARAASLRATKRAIAGPVSRITTNLVVCIAMTNGMSTLLEAAMIAAVSSPPGLIAR